MFSGIAVYNFLSKRRRFQAVLQQSSSSLNISRFIRLVALSLVEMFIAVPLTSWVLYDNAVQPLKTLGWTELHFDWSRIVFKAITIKGVYGREIFETWYKMIAMLENGLDIRRVITHRFKVEDFQEGFAAMRSGQSGKVVLDWC